MATRDYDTEELLVEMQLERIVWLEIAQRSARLTAAHPYAELKAIRRELQDAAPLVASEMREPFARDQIELSFPDFALDWCQFGDAVPEPFRPAVEIEHVVISAAEHWRDRTDAVHKSLPGTRGFRLADFAVQNDMWNLFLWWSESVLRNHDYNGKFNPVFDVLGPNGIHSHSAAYSMPARAPIPVAQRLDDQLTPEPQDLHQWLLNRKRATRSKQLVSRWDSLEVTLLAFCSLDEMEAGLGVEKAVETVLLRPTRARPRETDGVRKKVNALRARIESYVPSNLPWWTD